MSKRTTCATVVIPTCVELPHNAIDMPNSPSRPSLAYFRYAMAALLGAAALCILVSTWRWPLIWDAQVFHYVNFLIAHGFAPYREIVDMNLPGIYLIDGWVIKVFGPGDLAWRIFDFTLLGTLCLAMVAIARPYDWVAGLFAGVMFALIHASVGPQNTGQREEIMTVLIMVAYAFLFESRRRRYPWLMVFFGLSLGMACSVKPTEIPLGACLLGLAVWDLKKKGDAVAGYIWSSILGVSIAATIVATFLLRFHSVGALIAISRRLTPFYAGMERINFHLLLRFSLPIAVWVLLPFAVAVALSEKYRRYWEHWAILLGAAFGALSYFVQGKAYAHHRYTFVAFTLLWIALELTQAMHKTRWVKRVAIAGMCVGSFVLVPAYTRSVLKAQPLNFFTPALEKDLYRMGTDRLQNKVQCLDLVDGCYSALYHLRIVQSTGWMGDLLLFAPGKSPVVDFYRDMFWNSVIKNPPTVFILSNESFNQIATFDKLKTWPQFAKYLEENYKLVISREFEAEQQHGYRIYVRDGIPFPALDKFAPVPGGVPINGCCHLGTELHCLCLQKRAFLAHAAVTRTRRFATSKT